MAQNQEQSADVCDAPRAPPQRGVVPYVLSPDGSKHIEWMKTVFSATVEYMHMDKADKEIVHCSLQLNGGSIYLSDASCLPEQKAQSTLPPGGLALGFVHHLNVASETDANEIWKRAMENDAMEIVALKKQFWGAIYGSFRDPLGFEWAVCTCEKTKENQELVEEEIRPATD